MNRRRVERLRERPDLATVEEIALLAEIAMRSSAMRDGLSKVLEETRHLLPPTHLRSGGGAIERIHAAASAAIEAGAPPITSDDMADRRVGR